MTLQMLTEEVRSDDFGPDWAYTRGSMLQRVFSHDVFHCGELSQTLVAVGLPRSICGTDLIEFGDWERTANLSPAQPSVIPLGVP